MTTKKSSEKLFILNNFKKLNKLSQEAVSINQRLNDFTIFRGSYSIAKEDLNDMIKVTEEIEKELIKKIEEIKKLVSVI